MQKLLTLSLLVCMMFIANVALAAAPTNLVAKAVSSLQVDLSWQDNSIIARAFNVERKVSGGSFEVIGTTTPDATTYSDFVVDEEAEYTYRVEEPGFGGGYSNEDDATVLKSPTLLNAEAGSSGEINLSWTDESGLEEGYSIERKKSGEDFAEIGTVAADVETYNDTGLDPETEYTYRVRAYNENLDEPELDYSSYSNQSSVKAGGILPPTDLAATVVSSSKIDLSWTDNSTIENGYIIERDWGDSGNPLPIDTVDAGTGTLTYNDIGLPANTTFDYRVYAYQGTDPLNPDSVSDYATLSSPMTTDTSGDITRPTIEGFSPSDGSLDIETQNVKMMFSEAMNTQSVLVKTYFDRINVTDDVSEGLTIIVDFLEWFGHPGEAMKYNRYGCTGPYGTMDPGQFDITFSADGGEEYDTLEIILLDLTIGTPEEDIGAKEYKLSVEILTEDAAQDLAGNLLTLEDPDFNFAFTQIEEADGATGNEFLGLLEGAVDVNIPAGAFTGTAELKVNPYTEFLPEYEEGITGFAQLGAADSNVYGIGFEFEPAVTLEQPVRITIHYDDSSIPCGPDEESIRMYRYNYDVERWQPIIGAGFQPDTVNNELYIDYQGSTEYSIFALMSGYPYGDANGDGIRTITDAGRMLSDFVEDPDRKIFPDDGVFANGIVDLNYDPTASGYDTENPDTWPERLTITDVGVWLSRFVEIDSEFPVETNWQTWCSGGAPSIASNLPALDATKKVSLDLQTHGNNIVAAVNLDDTTNVFGAELWLTYNATLLRHVDVSASDGLTSYNNQTEGKLHIASMPLSNSNSLADIQFELLPGADRSALASIQLIEIRLNDGLISVDLVKEPMPDKLMLLQNYPNPFNPETWIPYQLNQSADVTIRIHDVNGHLVRRLTLGEQTPGNYISKDNAAYWDGQNNSGEKVASGVYFYQFEANGQRFIKKMMLLK